MARRPIATGRCRFRAFATPLRSLQAVMAFSAALLGRRHGDDLGNTANGALGRAPWVGDSAPGPTPALVPGVQGIRAIGTGLRHMLALTEAGTIISWGDDTYGNLGRDNDEAACRVSSSRSRMFSPSSRSIQSALPFSRAAAS